MNVIALSTGGLQANADDIQIKLDGTTSAESGLVTAANGLRVQSELDNFTASGGTPEEFTIDNVPFDDENFLFVFRNGALQKYVASSAGAGEYQFGATKDKIQVGDTSSGDDINVLYLY